MLPAPANTLPKEERLCGKSNISALVSEGKWGGTAHLRYCWRAAREEGDAGRIMVSVPKKFFKRAVKRNLLKRRIREAYRTQKQLLTAGGIDILFAWTGKETADYLAIRSELASILIRIDKAFAGSSKAGAAGIAEAGTAGVGVAENGNRQ